MRECHQHFPTLIFNILKVDSELDIYRDVFGTAPPVSPVSRVNNHAEDPRNLDAAELGGNEHQLDRQGFKNSVIEEFKA